MLAKFRRGLDRDEGFTLIELMVVVMIIAVLIAIAIPSFLGFRKSAQDRSAQAEIRTVLLAEKAIWLEEGAYTELAAEILPLEPNAVVDDFDSTIGVEPWLNVGSDQIVCLTRHSDSGNVFSVWESATAGTYFGTTDISGAGNCPGAAPAGYTQDGW